ncbi:MAG: tRNA (adenosine(37)-N6)-dimethylallyltransferase MiaA [Deltaproteobacteria bacterium]|nr:tRNA (adenosine(37)-N6)-dimethylallyltransferase MiaA [Deltaproteobacteria bacterium]
MPYNLLVILGATASGKTRVAVQVARALTGEIISADSRQVYRGMDIGTGKDLGEYGSVPYHLIDIVDPGYEFNVFEFQRRFGEVFREIQARGHLPLLAGGTGMYLDSVLRGYQLMEVPENISLRNELAALGNDDLAARLKQINPRLHNTTDLMDRNRLIRAIEIAEFQREAQNELQLPELSPIVFGIKWEREILRLRITNRLKGRLSHGLIEEVDRLHQTGIPWDTLEFYGLEYRYVAQYLKGALNKNDMFQKLNSAILQFAKRQETWFRRMERQGIIIHWLEGGKDPAGSILQKLQNNHFASSTGPCGDRAKLQIPL